MDTSTSFPCNGMVCIGWVPVSSKNPFQMKNPRVLSISPRAVSRGQAGFALVVTLSLMVLLTVIAVGFLSLGTVSLRTSTQGNDMAVAKSNARMALMMALGDLQKQAGPDTRVTARADITGSSKPPLTGVWRSWEGTDHDATGRPVAPNYSDHKEARFQGWLVSGQDSDDMHSPPDTSFGNTKVKLLGPDSVGTRDAANRQVYLEAVELRNAASKVHGSYAWWVAGENQKARLPKPYEQNQDSVAKWAVMAKSHAVADPKPFGLDKVLTPEFPLSDPTAVSAAAKAFTIRQGDLIDDKDLSREYFHDLSTVSTGLLTNTATGGWRKDLSLASESWSSLASSGLPLFRVSTTKDLTYGKASSGSPLASRSLLYPWSAYRSGTGGPIYNVGAIGSWTNLANYATLYKTFGVVGSNSAMSTFAKAADINGGTYDYIHAVRILPVVGRIQWVFSHKTVQTGATYTLQLVVQPVVTLWNPYNVRIDSISSLSFELNGTLPPVIDYKVGGSPLPSGYTQMVTLQGNNLADSTKARNVRGINPSMATYTINGTGALGPGETRVFSAQGLQAAGSLTLSPGLFLTGGSVFEVAKGVTPTGNITTDLQYNAEYKDTASGGDAIGAGLYMNMKMNGSSTVLAYRMSYTKALADKSYPAMGASRFAPVSMNEASVAPKPFLCVTFGARMATNTFLPSKGFVQSSPFVNYTAMGLKGPLEMGIFYQYPGTLHNVNSPFEYSFQPATGATTALPQAESGTNRGFILSGITAAEGVKRCIIGELPGRPLNSLAELQNWDARFENPIPPYGFNLVGNSDATPLIPSSAVVNSSASAKGGENLQHDDSYCLNHLLFDDWFFSSIAPEPANFGNPSVSSSAKSVYMNMLTDPSRPLLNRAYKAIPEDVAAASVSSTAANLLATQNVNTPSTSWKTIASRLEVEGMFNVNSTSVKAWRALLGHGRNQKIPYINGTGGNSLSGPTDYAFSRFTVAGDVESSAGGASAGRPGAAEFTGYRVLTESQLDVLAEEIVSQVRQRGPFLSLSEFVNRQLSSGNLALAGAVQSALNVLSNGSSNPFKVVQEDIVNPGSNITTTAPNPSTEPNGYAFPQAAIGYSLYGVPGWTRQADILRPLAPILTVRDDTFTIRAYGDCRDSSGVVKASVVCEATVRRTKDYVDPADHFATADLSPSSGVVPAKRAVNEAFGRRFEVVSFRWVSQNEI